jgi:hypothetical protein
MADTFLLCDNSLQQYHPFPSQWSMVHPDIQTETLKRIFDQKYQVPK